MTTVSVETDATIPIIRLWDVLLVPMQGELLDHQAERLRSDVLRKLKDTDARHLLVDVSGVWLMDSHLCSVLAGLAKAARYMGASTIITGLSPDVALTLESMGLQVGAGKTMRSLEEALASVGVTPAAKIDQRAEVARRFLAAADEKRSDK